jgi:hypothetical protein
MIIHKSELQIFPAGTAPKPVGLGDVAYAVFHPIAKAIDAVAGTNVQGCGGCQQRRQAWNEAVPDVRHPFSKTEEKKSD